jgi:hypothetical protein
VAFPCLVESMSVPANDEEPPRSPMAQYLRFAHVGFEFFVAVGAFTAGGYWLDRRLGTGVLFTLSGLALGFAGGLYSLYTAVFPPEKTSRKDSQHARGKEWKDTGTGGPREGNAKGGS